MIDFACKQFDISEIIKCGLGLTRIELKIFNFFVKNEDNTFITHNIAKKLNLNITTIQKAVKKLSEKKVIIKKQKNLEKGGYLYYYQVNSKKNIRKIIKNNLNNWTYKVEKHIDQW